MGSSCCRFSNRFNVPKRKIVLLLSGLDNAGKTSVKKVLAGENPSEVLPTVGFSSIDLQYKGYNVTLYDVGGGSQIRNIWHHYFCEIHGIIYVVDASAVDRIEESKTVLENLLENKLISGKPVLLLANKQDKNGAMDEIDLVEKMSLERLVNEMKCPTLVEICSTLIQENGRRQVIDPRIQNGYDWLIRQIIRDYAMLHSRVEEDSKKEQRRVLELREIWRKKKEEELEGMDSQEESPSDQFKPINDLINEKSNKFTSNGNSTIQRAVHSVSSVESLNEINETTNEGSSSFKEQLVKKEKPLKHRFAFSINNKVSPEVSNQVNSLFQRNVIRLKKLENISNGTNSEVQWSQRVTGHLLRPSSATSMRDNNHGWDEDSTKVNQVINGRSDEKYSDTDDVVTG